MGHWQCDGNRGYNPFAGALISKMGYTEDEKIIPKQTLQGAAKTRSIERKIGNLMIKLFFYRTIVE